MKLGIQKDIPEPFNEIHQNNVRKDVWQMEGLKDGPCEQDLGAWGAAGWWRERQCLCLPLFPALDPCLSGCVNHCWHLISVRWWLCLQSTFPSLYLGASSQSHFLSVSDLTETLLQRFLGKKKQGYLIGTMMQPLISGAAAKAVSASQF